ncbi:hypothetical protein A3A03_01050 [Candidatus Nomurabacteria bacterium RIFCSPLOWO2_01_FULL_40_18]|uniref:Uncharacterized protein n=1 Tax=Candidatus Nomurabacteria bacterium RIFCSPLOWO2_01_FULL_40_18 TaxID=1801773 RepID=A0A1F6XL68_9BACT|nr:MAG: hypothetical protein A3A03_01050 [Candidatus Nomurabacteria bacterium RIFCSPLOWO2_01_FULL_40_18]
MKYENLFKYFIVLLHRVCHGFLDILICVQKALTYSNKCVSKAERKRMQSDEQNVPRVNADPVTKTPHGRIIAIDGVEMIAVGDQPNTTAVSAALSATKTGCAVVETYITVIEADL